MKLIKAIFGVLVVTSLVLVGILAFGRNANTAEATGQEVEVCYGECPSVEFEASHYLYQNDNNNSCPSGWEYISGGDDHCRKLETFSTVVKYGLKSEDPNHCHRPTSQSLNVPNWAKPSFNKLPEKKDRPVIECEVPVAEKEVTVNVPELSCGIQEVSLSGEFQYTVTVHEDYLAVYVDGVQVGSDILVDQDNVGWPNWSLITGELGVGVHTVKVELYDQAGHNGLITSHESEFEIDECPVEEPEEPEEPQTPYSPPVVHTGTSTTEAPVCANVAPVLDPINPFVLRKGGDAIVQYVPTEGDKVHIYYYEVGNPTNAHALRDEPNDGYVDDLHLLGDKDWAFGIQQANGCAGGKIIWIEDGATDGWVMFRYNPEFTPELPWL